MGVMETSEICVIGAGITGLCAVKHCREYNRSVICYEIRSELGGLWTGTEPSVKQVDDNGREFSAAYDAVILNTTRFTSAFSDFPWPEETIKKQSQRKDRFATGNEFLQYIKTYATHFGVYNNIKFRTEVTHIAKSNPDTDRPWVVTYRSLDEKGIEQKSYHRHVLIASGRFRQAYIPDFPGLDKTPLEYNHAFHVRNSKDVYKGKRVVVIGGSFSGGDLSEVALRAGASKVTWAMTRNPELKSLIMIQRYPYNQEMGWDEWTTMFATRHYPKFIADKNLYNEVDFAHRRGNNAPIDLDIDRFQILHTQYLWDAVKEGRLEMVLATAESFSEDKKEVTLTNGEKLSVDVCTFATGCQFSYPFLDEDTLGKGGLADVNLFRYIIATNPNLWGLHFLYTTTFLGSAILPAEMMSRWVVHKIASGQLETDEQRRQLAGQTALNYRCFEKFHRILHTDIMEPFSYDIGCHPDRILRQGFFSLSPWKRRVYLATAFGTWTAQQYRLQGTNNKMDELGGPIISMMKSLFWFRYHAIVCTVDLAHLGFYAACLYPVYRALRNDGGSIIEKLTDCCEQFLGKLRA